MTARPSPATLALAVLAAAAGGAAAWFALGAIAAPSGFASQRTALETKVARLEQTAEAARRTPRLGPNAACPGLSDADLAAVRQGLAAVADRSGAGLTDLVLTPGPDAATRTRLAPLVLRLQATGPYETILQLLEGLGDAQPDIFVDTIDLTSAAPNVKLKLTGKVFCWTSAKL